MQGRKKKGWIHVHPFAMLMKMKSYDYYYLAKRNVLPDAEFRNRIPGIVKKGSKIHISAVCGKAMASVACLLKDFGCVVTGSDTAFHPPMGGVLKSRGIICLPPTVENLNNIDLVVIGNALSHDSLEVVEARKRNIPMISGPEALVEVFKNKRTLVVTGTHGKTTTSGLLTHVFLESDKEPAYMIGGVFQKSDDSYSSGGKNTKFAILEGDEYNCAYFDRAPKFLRYNATSAILTSVEHDHVDLYPSFEDYRQSFQFLVDDLPKDGFLVIHESVLENIDVSKCVAKVAVYGRLPISDFYYEINKVDSSGTTFFLKTNNFGEIKNIHIPLFGEYNVENATAVCALSLHEGISKDELLKALKNFAGTKERQELLGMRGDIALIRDYAHHPTAVDVTLKALRLRYPGKRMVAVFEPRSASSRRKVFEERYAESLKNADVTIVISPVFKETENRSEMIDTLNIQGILQAANKIAYNRISNFICSLEY